MHSIKEISSDDNIIIIIIIIILLLLLLLLLLLNVGSMLQEPGYHDLVLWLKEFQVAREITHN